ncbi:hypothetical protein FDC49_01870 [Clostridium sporogenes]|uniref:hypothetical protein n=1 Tax=Clostridium TaxID=1485 RepID=UPI000957A6B1|nr:MULTISPECIES: hypothetical protein [Clostridium]APU60748.1 hypothetical protein NPD8_2707 [Clostridium botulinum]NFH30961.1 hypothetical protein [Clostridium sporogenes]NFL18542.1 hypothetical protein [Clostridium sporogenes]NFN73397.1 hypothetical protein [Clostridium sporogenes]NFV23593.1 hypothetical protein [Clostridium sporogenes]
MNLFKNNLDILIDQYKKYFNDSNVNVNNFLQYKNKIKSKLNKFNKNKLINMKIEIETYLIELNNTSWDNYVSIRIAVIATIISVILSIGLNKKDFYLKVFLYLAVLYMFTFTYIKSENVKKKMFYNILIQCVDEVLKDKCKNK